MARPTLIAAARRHAPDPRRARRRGRWRPHLGAVHDDHEDRRCGRHPGPDLRTGVSRCGHRPLHLQRERGSRGTGPHRAPLAGPHRGRHPFPPRDGAGCAGGGRPGPAAQPWEPAQSGRDQRGRPGGQGPGRSHPHRGQRRVASPRSLQALRGSDTRGSRRIGADGAGLLRRGRLRRRQDLGEGLLGAPHDRGLPAGVRDL